MSRGMRIVRHKEARTIFRVGIPGMYLLCTPFLSLFLWILSDETGITILYAQTVVCIGVSTAIAFFISSYVVPQEFKSVSLANFFFGIGVLPCLFLFLFFSLAFFLVGVHDEFLKSAVLIVIFFIALGWCLHSVFGLKQRIQNRRFIEKEFRIEETQIVMRTPPKTDLDPPPIKPGSRLDKAGSWLLPKLLLLVPMAYPLQRLFSDTGGLPAVLLLLSILSLPLAIYILGRMACGYYLWIHTIRKLERQHGKPVVFERSEGN